MYICQHKVTFGLEAKIGAGGSSLMSGSSSVTGGNLLMSGSPCVTRGFQDPPVWLEVAH